VAQGSMMKVKRNDSDLPGSMLTKDETASNMN